jgi:phosphoglucomutase
MTRLVTETNESVSQRNTVRASAYSAHIQEAMRYDRLRSAEYLLVMTILHAVLQGYTQEQWQEEQQRPLQTLQQQQPDPQMGHADEVNRYEQTVRCLKDLLLWPWE